MSDIPNGPERVTGLYNEGVKQIEEGVKTLEQLADALTKIPPNQQIGVLKKTFK